MPYGDFISRREKRGAATNLSSFVFDQTACKGQHRRRDQRLRVTFGHVTLITENTQRTSEEEETVARHTTSLNNAMIRTPTALKEVTYYIDAWRTKSRG